MTLTANTPAAYEIAAAAFDAPGRTINATALDVAKAGEMAGYWELLPIDPGRHVGTWCEVMTRSGVLFTLSTVAGYGSKKSTIKARLGTLRFEHGLVLAPLDVRSEHAHDEAQCSAERAADAIAKELNRRVMQKPENLAHGAAMLARKAQRLAEWARLRREIKPFEAMGYTFKIDAREHYQAKGHRPTASDTVPYMVTVYVTGRVTFDYSSDSATACAVLEALIDEDNEKTRRAA